MSESVRNLSIILALLLALGAGCVAVFTNPAFELSGTTYVKSSDPLSVTLHETTWDSTDSDSDGIADCATLLLQESRISISPVVENTSSVSGWVYLTVDTPILATGQAALDYSVEPGWILIDSSIVADRQIKTYCFDTPLAPGDTTPILFSDLVYLTDQEPESGNYIKLIASAIQSEHIDTPVAGWQAFVAKAGE